MNVSEYIFDFFEKKGINTVFMITGGQAMWLDDAVGRNKSYNIIFNHHEQACTMSADAYGRMMNKPAITLVTAGPAAVNAMNGVVGGYIDSAPMIIISGQSQLFFVKYEESTGIRQHGIQGINIKPLVEKITKYFVTIDDPKKLNIYLEEAYNSAITARMGPVWLDVPLDVQNMQIDAAAMLPYKPKITKPPKHGIEQAVKKTYELLKKSKRPVILAGQGIKLAGATEQFRKFIEYNQIPVITARLGIDLIESDNRLYVGRPGNYGDRAANFAIQNADLIISAGCKMASSLVSYDPKNFGKNSVKIAIDIDRKELDKPGAHLDYKARIDCRDYFNALNEIAVSEKLPGYKEWVETCNNWKMKYPVVLKEYRNEDPVNSYYFIDRLCEAVSPESAVLVDAGSCFHVTCQAWKVKKGQNFLTSGGLSSMGYWVASIGVCMANDRKETICITGDGSLQMNIQEFATIRQNNLPIKVFIFNNNGYGIIKLTQRNFMEGRFMGVNPATGVWFPDSLEIAKAYGIKGIRISHVNEVENGIKEALAHNGPVICDVITPEYQLLIPRIASDKMPDGTLVARAYDDMFPFLPREEYDNNIIAKKNKK